MDINLLTKTLQEKECCKEIAMVLKQLKEYYNKDCNATSNVEYECEVTIDSTGSFNLKFRSPTINC